MIRRPLNEQFADKVLKGIKITTIRDKKWAFAKPIMLFRWEGKPYRSKQIEICPIWVKATWEITISHCDDGRMIYLSEGIKFLNDILHKALFELEGFADQNAMDEWFRNAVKKDQTVVKHIMLFDRIHNP